MKQMIQFSYNYMLGKLQSKKRMPQNIRLYLESKEDVYSAQSINQYIYKLIKSNKPFMVGRFGATELMAVRTFDFELKSKYFKTLQQMQMCAGFFPPTEELGDQFKDLILESIPKADVMGIWLNPFESYYLKKYGKNELKKTYLLDLEPWSAPDNPWSAALKGKKVLVIHPFTETIQIQYQRREEIFPGTSILPDFELQTLKAVQTIAGEIDERFETWFDALEWMYQEAMKIDFDIAIIGCGAYGFPLAAKLKDTGKQAIHLAGATQLLFGIKGKRWEENEAFGYVQKFFNDSWVYPDVVDIPKQAKKVEDGCYW